MCTIPFPIRTATIMRELDKRVIVCMWGGKTLIGILRSVDQFANIVLHRAIERIHVGKFYGDISRGVYVIRGENVMLIGAVDQEKEKSQPFQKVSVDEILLLQKNEEDTRREKSRSIKEAIKERSKPSTSTVVGGGKTPIPSEVNSTLSETNSAAFSSGDKNTSNLEKKN